jgi:hypothetical protein
MFVISQHNHKEEYSDFIYCWQDDEYKLEWTISKEYNNLTMQVTFGKAGFGWGAIGFNNGNDGF